MHLGPAFLPLSPCDDCTDPVHVDLTTGNGFHPLSEVDFSLIRQGNLELWGGVECTVNRVGDQYFEQLTRTGHHSRISDLERFAELGIVALRQPVLWELVAPDGIDRADWTWTDSWLARLRELGIRPIVGLVHHGSGPRQTNLLDPDFPARLAQYAEAVAVRYPWVSYYTPVNEPLTTARFSALYGHWFPHARDPLSFLRALLTQCKAIVLAMRAIRQVNPDAKLVQTEDLGKTFSTPKLRYQADFENERRWLPFDLLAGRVDRNHALWGYLKYLKIPERELAWFQEQSETPSILGFNYYLTSERYLDHEIDNYPVHLHGGNGRHRYVDVEAARVRAEGIAGARLLLCEAWERYRLPIAVTECHNGCTREEQLRWFNEVWHDCVELRTSGVDVRAVTAWSLLGAFDWNTLVTAKNDHYEPGVFDIRAPQPRPTAIAQLAERLSKGLYDGHPLLDAPGWWHRPERHHNGGVTDSGRRISSDSGNVIVLKHKKAHARPLLITGGSGTLGRAFARACVMRGIPHRLTLRSDMDIADPASVAFEFERSDPWAVINTAGYVRVDEAESEVERCMRENASGPVVLAAECQKRGMQFVTFSSDLVFDGSKARPYVESDEPNPLNVYGRSKRSAELEVLRLLPSALVVRTSAFFGPWDENNFITVALRELAAGRHFSAADDAFVSPTYVPDLVGTTLDLMFDGEHGIWHLANPGAVSWFDLARLAAKLANIRDNNLVACTSAELRLPAPRPLYSALSSEKAWIMPPLEHALERYTAQRSRDSFRDAEAAA